MAATTSKPSVFLAGATGLTGRATISAILASPSHFHSLTTLSRRPLPTPSSGSASLSAATPHTNVLLDFAEPAAWSASLGGGGSNKPRTFVSCLGTTRRIAGSVEKQREIDLELNYRLAKAAREEGFDTMILVSTRGASSTSSLAYPQMRGELEDRVAALGFPTTHVLRPGFLIGAREDSRPGEFVGQTIYRALRAVVPGGGMDTIGIDALLVGKAIAKLALVRTEGVHYYDNTELLNLARSSHLEA